MITISEESQVEPFVSEPTVASTPATSDQPGTGHPDAELRAFAERNVLVTTEDLTIGLVDFERFEPGPMVRDFVRLADEWAHRPDLEAAFMTGYGRTLTPAEAALLPVLEALDAVSGIAWGSAEGGRDRHVVERGQRTLARLRANIPTP